MKRQLDFIDRSLPLSVLAQADVQESIEKINTVFTTVDSLLLKKQRIDLALNAEPQIKQKILRLYIRHEYYPATEVERSYFLVNVEGMLLDNSYDKSMNLTSFFEKVSLQTQTEKKYNQGALMFEWKEEDFPLGSNAHAVQMKVFADKPTLCKISLHRSTAVALRYNISDQLRSIIPYLRFDPTEDEVLLAVWQYIELSGLFVAEKDKRYFKLTEDLKELFLGDRENPLAVMMVSALRTKLAPHLVVARPVLVEHLLNTTNTPEVFAQSLKSNYSLRGGGRWPTAAAYSRVGGRVFELEVDVRDQACFGTMATLNQCTSLEYNTNDRIRLHTEKLAFLARRLQVLDNERTTLTAALDLLQAFDSTNGTSVKAESTVMEVDTSNTSPSSNSISNSNNNRNKRAELLAACSLPLYQRIRARPVTERFAAPSHTPHAAQLHAAAVTELSEQGQPLVQQALQAAAASSKADSMSATAPVALYSSLHILSGYLDVGSDDLFQTHQTWLVSASQQLVNHHTNNGSNINNTNGNNSINDHSNNNNNNHNNNQGR